jgi:hypothetical protein
MNPSKERRLGTDAIRSGLPLLVKTRANAGGARVITCVYVADNEVYLLSVYDKSERSSLNDTELKELVDWIQEIK